MLGIKHWLFQIPECDPNMEKAEHRTASARNNWRKVFAVKKFLSIAKFQSEQAPADLLVGQKFVVGKKFANGAFGQVMKIMHTILIFINSIVLIDIQESKSFKFVKHFLL